MAKKGSRHLNMDDRLLIEEYVGRGATASAIARMLGVSPSTVTREVRANRVAKAYSPGPAKNACDLCARYDSCSKAGDLCDPCTRNGGWGRCRACRAGRCFERCPDFIAGPRCARILSWPHTCDGCASAAVCGKPAIHYRAYLAQAAADSRKSAPRSGICCSTEEIGRMNALVTPLIRKGQSPAAIWAEHAGELPVSPRTYYRYMERGLTDAIALDLPRKVRRKRRREERGGRPAPGRERIDRTGRTYGDFCALTEQEILSAWQIDTVEGRACDSQRLLTLELPRILFQPCLLLSTGSADEVVAALDSVERLIGSPGEFERAMPILLADRGREFDDWEGMERSCLVGGARRCRVFYTDPERADQKGACERNHSELRRILPKGRADFDALTPRDAALIGSHVNCYPRPSLGGARPFDLAEIILPEALTAGIGLFRVEPDEVTMRPELVPGAFGR